MSDFDVLVIGSGAGGGVAAYEFAKRGKRVLVVDRGKVYPPGFTGRDHLRNHRYNAYGHNTGPEEQGNPRVMEDQVRFPWQNGYNNNAMAVGGGTVVYGAQAWRFHPDDFRMASRYGVPSGSTLADWPIGYDDLAPFYEAIEHGIGVCGGPPAANMPARTDYPMPAMSLSHRGQVLQSAAQGLGWAHQAVPLLINSEARDGRDACIRCQHCVGFGCPTNAKNGTQNTVLPKMLAYPGCELWAEARAMKLLTTSQGDVTGALIFQGGEAIEVMADVVVLAAGAIETARLLLLTRTAREPNGVGNNHDWVGRNLQGHYYPGGLGLFNEPITDTLGPGPSISITQFNHGNEGIVGGGMLADDFVALPALFARDRRWPGVPDHGLEFKQWVRKGYSHTCHIVGPVQEIPSPDSRVTLTSEVTDDLDLPVIRLTGTTHPETVKTSRFMAERATEWLYAAGATEVNTYKVGLGLSAGQHQAGTCRMARTPSEGVVNPQGVVFGHDNLLVCDGSVHVTNGGFNPVLTIMANALRSASLFR